MKKNYYTKFNMRIFALLSCILLILNFGLSVAFSAEPTLPENSMLKVYRVGSQGILNNKKYLNVALSGGGGASTFTVKDVDEAGNFQGLKDGVWYFDFIMKEGTTGLYRISASYRDRKGDENDVKYKIVRANKKGPKEETNGFDNTLGLALPSVNPDLSGYVQQIREGKTSVVVILEEGYHYGIRLYDQALSNRRTVTINLERVNGVDESQYSYSNVPSSYVTTGIANEGDVAQVAPVKGDYKTVQIKTNDIAKFVIDAGMARSADLERSPSWVESGAVGIMMALGETLLWIAEKSLKIKNLTLDKLIFNKIDGPAAPIVDLTKFGGAKLGDRYARGILTSNAVITAVSDVYSGFRNIAIVIYLLSLLYMGIKVLLAVGTPDESKMTKYIEYWITGALMLFMLPYLFPILPYLVNTLTEAISENAITAGQYDVIEIAEYLGIKYFGEDASVDAMKQKIDEKLAKLEERANRIREGNTEFVPLTEQEIQERFDQYIPASVKNDPEMYAAMYEQYRQCIEYVNSHSDNFTDNNIDELSDMVYGMADSVYSSSTSDLDRSMAEYRAKILQNYPQSKFTSTDPRYSYESFLAALDEGLNLVRDNKGQYSYSSSAYNYTTIQNILRENGYTYVGLNWPLSRSNLRYFFNQFNKTCNNKYLECQSALDSLTNFLINEYADSAVFYEMDKLESMQASITEDPMVHLKLLAKTEGRLAYAIAWWIILFQLFSLLFMYYKRVFVIIILICLFPLVMAVYVVDKMGDGQAQSLQNWFKEFFANCAVQFFHACIYVFLINLGITICQQDPSRNWVFLVMCIAFLFPAERMLRGFVGLESSTLGTLKLNIVGGIVAVKTLGKTGFRAGKAAVNTSVAASKAAKNMGNTIKDFGNQAKLNGMTKAQYAGHLLKEDMKKEDEKYAQKRKKKKDYHDSRSAGRDMARERDKKAKELNKEERTAKESLYAARQTVRDVAGNVKGKAGELARDTANRVKNSGVGQAVGKASGAAKRTLKNVSSSKVGSAMKNVGSKAGAAAKYAGKKLYNNSDKLKKGAKNFAKNYGKAATFAIGAARGMDTLGQGGFAAGASEFGQITSKAIPNQKLGVNAPSFTDILDKYDEKPAPGGSVAAQSIRNRLRNSSSSSGSSGGSSGSSGRSPTITMDSVGGGTSGGGSSSGGSTTVKPVTKVDVKASDPKVTKK